MNKIVIIERPASVKGMVVIKDRAIKIHFIGIGGSGMSGLAKLALQAGCSVSGSDLKGGEATDALRDLGAQVFIGHNASHIGADTHQVVYSSAVNGDNPELWEARKRGLETISRGEFLARMMARYEGIAVAGAHGKTTTTAMIATVLHQAGLDPTVAAGGTLVSEGTNAWLGHGRHMVAEADESDGSFLLLKPKFTIVTNVENDHMDYYGSQERLQTSFKRFIAQTDPQGLLVLNADDAFLARLKTPGVAKAATYGWQEEALYRAELIELPGMGSRSRIYEAGELLGTLELDVPGRHNVTNALAAVAVARSLQLQFEVIGAALKAYRGVGRRFQVVGEAAGRRIIDDYAHHPTEIRATLAAARQLNRRIVAVFQPHRFSRTARLYQDFGSVFQDADLVVVTDIYSAGEPPLPGVSGALIAEEIQRNGHPQVYYRSDWEGLSDLVADLSLPGDVIFTIGAGNVWQLGSLLLRHFGGV